MEFKKGDWVNNEDKITKILDVYPIRYEKFDEEVRNGDFECGEIKCNYYLLRDLCDYKGKFVSSKPYLFFNDYYFEPLQEEEWQVLEDVKEAKREKYEAWENKEVAANVKECELRLSFEASPGESKSLLKQFKKVCKQMPILFTFNELFSQSSALGIDLSSCTEDWFAFDNQVSFRMKYNLEEVKDGVIYFHKIGCFDYTDAAEDELLLEKFFNFEMLYLSFVLFLNRYISETADENAVRFNVELKKAVLALTKGEKNEMAGQFYDFVPKKMFAVDEAFTLFKEYIGKYKSQYNLEALCNTFEDRKDWSMEVYKLSYEWAKGR
ncbi:MAG: hypothetical protein MJZ33_07725 [Paludibacteraceae bacterium]|nr:hypothetical protein [Paludibacteraceae bacterium]